MPDALSLVAWAVDRDRREEILGDLCELRTTESVAAFWGDVVGVCLHAPRVRRWVGTAAALLLLLLGVFALGRDNSHRIVTARDAAGSFVLEFDGLRVVRATLDGAPVAAERLVQDDRRLVIRGGAGSGDLNIRLRPDGSFYWRGRAPLSTSTH